MPDDRPGDPRRPRTPGTNGSPQSDTPTVRTRFDDVSETPTVRTRFDDASEPPTVRTRFDVSETPTARMRFDDASDASDEPVDLMAVQADDELIDALASGMAVSAPGSVGYDADDHVAALLAAWKSEVDAAPLPPLVDVDVAAARVRAAARPPTRRLRLVAPIAAAAVIVLSVGGIGYNAGATAGPDDGLAWEIAKVVDGDRVESVLAAERVEELIAEAKEALTRGEPEVAAAALAAAAQDLRAVRPEENASDLAELQSFLEAKVAETPPGTPTQPDSPLRSDPTRPVPPGAAPTPVPAAVPAPLPAPLPAQQPASRPDPRPSGPVADDSPPVPAPLVSSPAPPVNPGSQPVPAPRPVDPPPPVQPVPVSTSAATPPPTAPTSSVAPTPSPSEGEPAPASAGTLGPSSGAAGTPVGAGTSAATGT